MSHCLPFKVLLEMKHLPHSAQSPSGVIALTSTFKQMFVAVHFLSITGKLSLPSCHTLPPLSSLPFRFAGIWVGDRVNKH